MSMLVAAPFLVHRLGLSQYGIWMLVNAILGSMGTLSMGFGDATVKYVSAYRGQNNLVGVEHTIRATLTINVLWADCSACWYGSSRRTLSITFSRLSPPSTALAFRQFESAQSSF